MPVLYKQIQRRVGTRGMLRNISKAEAPVLLRVDVSVQVEQEEGTDIGWMLIRAHWLGTSCVSTLF